MANTGTLLPRDIAVLQLLDRTPATTDLLVKASNTFPCGPFRDHRRVRERLQTLARMHLVRSFPATQGIGGPVNWYKLTLEGYRYLHGSDGEPPRRARFEPIPPSRFHHTAALADVIVHTLVAAHIGRTAVARFFGDGELPIEAAGRWQFPDCFFQLEQSGREWNLLFEIDQSTEPLDSLSANAVREKILTYEAHQDAVLQWWKEQGRVGQRPTYRVVFLNASAQRAIHILWLAQQCARNQDRHLCYAAPQQTFLGTPEALSDPLFNDHHGGWQSLVNVHPSSKFTRTPIRLVPPVTIFGRH